MTSPTSGSQKAVVEIPSHKLVRGRGTPLACKSMLGKTIIFKQYPSDDPSMPAHLVSGVLFYEGMEEEIRSTLGLDRFPMPFSPPSPPVYKIVPVEGFGLSMVATTNIARGQTIAIERPLLVYPQTVVGLNMAGVLALYERMVDELDPENREAVYALRNVKGPDWPSHLKGILDTNTLGIGRVPGYPAMYAAAARDISRVNHRRVSCSGPALPYADAPPLSCSCSPNACHDFDVATLTVVLRAHAPIRAGEQVTISYVDTARPRVERREELSRRYKFVCMCKACNRNEMDVIFSDLNRLLLNLRAIDAADDEEAFEKWLADGAPVQQGAMLIRGPEDMLNAVDSMNGFSRAMYTYTVMEEEGLFHGRIWEPVLARLVIGYSVLQEENQVRKYALTAALLKKALTGSDGGWAAVVRNPRGSDWWGKRLKN